MKKDDGRERQYEERRRRESIRERIKIIVGWKMTGEGVGKAGARMFLKTHWMGNGLGMRSMHVSYPLASPFCRSLDAKTACRAIESHFLSNGF